jgi:transposase-like protein
MLRQMVEDACCAEDDPEARLWEDLQVRGREQLRALLEAAMKTELGQRLGYEPYRRDALVHTNYRNGCYRRNLDTQFGVIEGLQVPRARRGKSHYWALERYARRAPWVNELVSDMFVAGVSTRRVGRIVRTLVGASVSASTVSAIATSLDAPARAWHARPLTDDYCYLLADGVYLRVKGAKETTKKVALCVYGITALGQRELIDYRLADSESEQEWLVLLRDLFTRGLKGEHLELITTDGGQGLINALQEVYPRVPLQRCWAHKLRNVATLLTKTLQEAGCVTEAARIYQAPCRSEAIRRYRVWVKKWRSRAPKAVACLERDIEAMLSFFGVPSAHRKLVRTTNAIERQFREVRRRTNPMTCFANTKSADRILYAIFRYANQRWADSLLKDFQGFTHKS